MASEPLLVVGRDGSGKSECLRALSWLLGEQLQQFNLTPGGWQAADDGA
jgi:energy-coupling factor transporter ATP-binding protein EcfA2